MNKRQKEVAQVFLDDEAKVLKSLEKSFSQALADIKRNIRYLSMGPETTSKAYQLEFQQMLKQQISASIDLLHSNSYQTVSQYLNSCYENGFVGSVFDLHGQGVPLMLPLNQKQVLKAVSRTADGYKLSTKLGGHMHWLKRQVQSEISRGFAQDMSYQEIARNISNYGQATYNRAMNIAQTEGHRIQNEAKMDSMRAGKDGGADIVRQWDSTLDGKTRKSHQELDGQIRELDEPFEVNGKNAMHPGGFGSPSEDCRCRCAMLQRARWALDEDELETLRERAAYYGLDKADSFEEFKAKYLKVGVKDGIINMKVGNGMRIDKFTPCLENARTGEIVNTTYKQASVDELSGLKGWKFNWLGDDLSEAMIFKLSTVESDAIQGLVALENHPVDKAVYVHIAESAPHNMGDNREFYGVGGHLFAIAAQYSKDLGYGGFVFMDAKNMELVEHYSKILGAKFLGMPHPYRMFIDERSAEKLLEIYTLEGE